MTTEEYLIILDAQRDLILQPDLLSTHPRIGKLDERLRWFAEYDVKECRLIHQLQRCLEVLEFANGSIA